MFERVTAAFRARPPPPAEPGACSILQNSDGKVLAAGKPFIGMTTKEASAPPIVCVRPGAHTQAAFLLAADLSPVAIRDDGLRATAVSAFIVQGKSGKAWRLRHPLAPVRFMSATEPGQGGPEGCVIFNSLGQSARDWFTPLAIKPGTATRQVEAAAAELQAAASTPAARHVLQSVAAGRLRGGFIEAVLRVLPRDELAILARLLMEDDAARALLARHLPDNSWFARVLPDLAAWAHTRQPVSGRRTTSPTTDEFAGDGLEGYGQVQAGMALTALARATVRPRNGICLLASARNEGPYLLEWLAYHRAIGFAHAFIYTNDNEDGSDRLLGALARAGEITVIDNHVGTHFGPQYKAHAHALMLLPQILEYRWCAILDLDEYLGFDATLFRGVQDYLAWQETQPVDAIALCWQLFTARAGDVWRDEFTPARFTRRECGTHYIVKSIFKPRLFWNAQPHYPHSTLNAPFVFRGEAGLLHHHQGADRPAAHAARPSAEYAWVNHYILRSAPEALWKLARGRPGWSGQEAQSSTGATQRQEAFAHSVSRTFVNLAGKTDLVEDRRLLACAKGLDAEMARLRRLPGVAEEDARIKAAFRANLARVMRGFVAEAPLETEPEKMRAFRRMVEDCLAV